MIDFFCWFPPFQSGGFLGPGDRWETRDDYKVVILSTAPVFPSLHIREFAAPEAW